MKTTVNLVHNSYFIFTFIPIWVVQSEIIEGYILEKEW